MKDDESTPLEDGDCERALGGILQRDKAGVKERFLAELQRGLSRVAVDHSNRVADRRLDTRPFYLRHVSMSPTRHVLIARSI